MYMYMYVMLITNAVNVFNLNVGNLFNMGLLHVHVHVDIAQHPFSSKIPLM